MIIKHYIYLKQLAIQDGKVNSSTYILLAEPQKDGGYQLRFPTEEDLQEKLKVRSTGRHEQYHQRVVKNECVVARFFERKKNIEHQYIMRFDLNNDPTCFFCQNQRWFTSHFCV